MKNYFSRRSFAIVKAAAVSAASLSLALGAYAAALPLYEAFPSGYNDSTTLRSTAGSPTPATFWTTGTAATDVLIKNTSGLSYQGIFQASGAKGLNFPNPTGATETKTVNTTFTAISGSQGQTIYISFLIKINHYPGSVQEVIALGASSSGLGKALAFFVDQNGKLGMAKASSTVAETPSAGVQPTLATNQTYLIVGRYTVNATTTTDDVIDCWTNPPVSSYGGSDPGGSVMTGATGQTDNLAKELYIYSGPANGVFGADLSAIRVSTNWAGVVPGISSNPTNTTVNAGSTATFNVTAGAGDSKAVAYQWQVSTDNGSTWNNVSVGSGGTTSSYSTNSDAAATGNQFRCQVTCTEAAATSSSTTATTSVANSTAATLTVNNPCTSVGISSQPSSTSVSVGSTATFSVTATGTSPVYQWQISTDSGSTWNNVTVGSGGTTSSYSTNAVYAANGNQFRCHITSGCDASVTNTSAATLTVTKLSSSVGLTASANNVSSSTAVSFTATVSGSGATPTGTVQFKTNSAAFGSAVSLSSGSATSISHTLPRGSVSVSAEYSGDSTYLASTNSLTETITNSSPVANADTVTRNAGSSVKVSFSSLLANDTDADGDTLSITSVDATTSGGVSLTTNSTSIYIPASVTNSETFSYAISDGNGGTATGTVTVNVASVSGQQAQITSVTGSGPYTATMIFYGVLSTGYHVQRSTDLSTWTSPGDSVTSDSNGVINYSDTDAPSGGAYYRLVYP